MRKLIFLLFFASVPNFADNFVYVIKVEGTINPATAEYISSSIKKATEEGAECLVIELDTPGGLLESTRSIVKSILSAEIPVVVFVYPSGARAGSAGVFITLSAHIAVMAPGTNIGAAHPVGIGGMGDTSKVMEQKITNDAAAFVRTIAEKRNRNVKWAERAVRESISSTETEALKDSVIDLIAKDLKDLLDKIDGRKVKINSEEKILRTKDAKVKFVEMNWREKLLALISDPNIAYILLLLGIYGILFELYNPGAIFPGVIGAICLILAFYSLQALPINYAGLALIVLGIILLLLEIKIVSNGLLTIGGAISLLLGSVMLINSPFELMQISLTVIITAVVLTVLFFLFAIGMALKAQRRKPTTGKEALVGERGIALTKFKPASNGWATGQVRVHGEIWKAISQDAINPNEEIVVRGVEGLTLKVEKVDKQK
jgi:membrane-bound serine protease (ClpP class)